MAFERKIMRRIRRRPNKRWHPNEDAEIVSFLKSNRNFEKPTAQVYYKNFLNKTRIESDWKSCRSKVRNMRIAYLKAKSWQNSADAGTLENHETKREGTLKLFPHYDDFEDLFGSPNSVREVKIENVDIRCAQLEYPCDDINSTTNSLSDILCESSRTSDGDQSASTSKRGQYSITNDADYLTQDTEILEIRQQKLYQDNNFKPEISNKIKQQSETFVIQNQKLEQEIQLKEKEIALRQEQFYFEKEKIQKELEHKEKELKSQEKLKVLELEMKERIAMEELHLRERIAIKELQLKEKLAMKEA